VISKPIYMFNTGESVETPMASEMEDFTSSRVFRVAGPKAFAEAGITHRDVDHLMIYDAFAHLPIYGLEDLGFVPRGEAGASSPRSATPPSAGICRSKPMAAAFPTCIRHGPLQTSGPGSRRRCNRCTRRCTSALLASACWRCPEPRRQRCRARPRR
jgi:hypothetical protein